jgi:hypothetical protein
VNGVDLRGGSIDRHIAGLDLVCALDLILCKYRLETISHEQRLMILRRRRATLAGDLEIWRPSTVGLSEIQLFVGIIDGVDSRRLFCTVLPIKQNCQKCQSVCERQTY